MRDWFNLCILSVRKVKHSLKNLPHQHAKAPNVAAFGEDFVLQALGCHPLQGQLQALLQHKVVGAFVQPLGLLQGEKKKEGRKGPSSDF